MSKHTIPFYQFLNIIKSHFFTSLIIFFMGMFIFAGIVTTNTGNIIFTSIATLIYFFSIYNAAFDIADRDHKSYTPETPFALKGLILPFGLLIVNIILYALYFVTWKYMTIDGIICGGAGWINNILYVMWTFPFNAFINIRNGMLSWYGYIIVAVLPFIASALGYFARMKNFDITSKFTSIMYEKKKNTEEKK